MKRHIIALVLLTALIVPKTSFAYLYGTTIYHCGIFVCSYHNTTLTPIADGILGVIAAEHNALLSSAQDVDAGYAYGTIHPTSNTYLDTYLVVLYFSTPFPFYVAQTSHHFLEADGGSFDEYSDGWLFW